MGQSAQQVRADIERTREDLGQDLDAIGDRSVHVRRSGAGPIGFGPR
jgi:hypothetical protein